MGCYEHTFLVLLTSEGKWYRGREAPLASTPIDTGHPNTAKPTIYVRPSWQSRYTRLHLGVSGHAVWKDAYLNTILTHLNQWKYL